MSDHHKETSGASQRPINWRAFCHLEFIDYRGYPVLARIYSLLLALTASALLALTLFSFTLNIWYGVYCLLVIAPLGMLLMVRGLTLSAVNIERLLAQRPTSSSSVKS